MTKRAAVFLDRDGVINVEKNYLFQVSEFEFVDNIFENCRRFIELGYLLVIVTNQAGIAKGYYDEEAYAVLTSWLRTQLTENGVSISGIYHCPHHPEGVIERYTTSCTCRKPNPGMLLQAKKELNLDMERSLMVGDKISDVEAGASAGVGRNILVKTGHSIAHLTESELTGFEVVDSLSDIEIAAA